MIASISSFLCAAKSLQVMVDTSTVCADAEAVASATAMKTVQSNRMPRLPYVLFHLHHLAVAQGDAPVHAARQFHIVGGDDGGEAGRAHQLRERAKHMVRGARV